MISRRRSILGRPAITDRRWVRTVRKWWMNGSQNMHEWHRGSPDASSRRRITAGAWGTDAVEEPMAKHDRAWTDQYRAQLKSEPLGCVEGWKSAHWWRICDRLSVQGGWILRFAIAPAALNQRRGILLGFLWSERDLEKGGCFECCSVKQFFGSRFRRSGRAVAGFVRIRAVKGNEVDRFRFLVSREKRSPRGKDDPSPLSSKSHDFGYGKRCKLGHHP